MTGRAIHYPAERLAQQPACDLRVVRMCYCDAMTPYTQSGLNFVMDRARRWHMPLYEDLNYGQGTRCAAPELFPAMMGEACMKGLIVIVHGYILEDDDRDLVERAKQ